MRVSCRCNLDLLNEQWPSKLPAVPCVGDHIASRTKRGAFRLDLEVVRVTWEYSELFKEYIPHIELYMNSFQRQLTSQNPEAGKGSVTAFYEWYAPIVGKSVSFFI